MYGTMVTKAVFLPSSTCVNRETVRTHIING